MIMQSGWQSIMLYIHNDYLFQSIYVQHYKNVLGNSASGWDICNWLNLDDKKGKLTQRENKLKAMESWIEPCMLLTIALFSWKMPL